jgi:hypothetical protein
VPYVAPKRRCDWALCIVEGRGGRRLRDLSCRCHQYESGGPAGASVHYQRRRSEETTLYRLVKEPVESFFAHVERETGEGLPDFVKDEFEAIIEDEVVA